MIKDTTSEGYSGDVLGGSKNLESSLIESLTDAVISIDDKMMISLWNKAAEDILGYSYDEVIGKPIDIIIPEKYLDGHKQGVGRFHKTGVSKVIGKTVELEAKRKDGRLVPIELSLSAEELGEGHIFTAILRDITERKIVEEELLLLQKVNNMLNAGVDQEEVFKTLADGLRSLYNYESVAIHLICKDKTCLIVKGYSADSKVAKRLEKLTGLTVMDYKVAFYEGSLFQEVIDTGKPVIVDDIKWVLNSYGGKKYPQSLIKIAAKLTKAKWGIGVPLLAGDKLVGVIGCGSTYELTDKDSQRFAVFGAQAGLAIEGRQRYELLEKEIKAHNRSLAALRIKENAIASSINAVTMADLDGHLTYVNGSFLKMWGYESDEEVLGKPVAGFWQAENVALEVQNTLLSKGSWMGELVAKKKDGSLFNVQLSENLVTDDDNRLICMMASCVNITKRVEIEEALRESKDRYAKAEKIAQFGHWDWNFVENKTIWSMEAYQIFGVDPDQFMPLYDDFLSIIHPLDRERFESAVEATISRGEPFNIEYRIIHSDKTVRFIHSVGDIRFDGHGRPLRLVGTVHDITERKHNEERLKKYSRELEESNRLKDIFIDIMRHDMLNPAGVAKNMADMALMAEDDPQKKEVLQIAVDTTKRVIDMIENASVFAMLDSGQELAFEETDLGSVMRVAVKDVAGLANQKKTKITFDTKGGYKVRANPLIYDVFSNLLSNAIKYGPEKSEVLVGIEKSGGDWKVSVSDRGEGISDEHKEAVFNRFKRVKKGAVKGTGLGLAIVKMVVDAHCGRVWIEDNPGGGSIFYITLPRG